MAYSHATIGDLKSSLAHRLGDSGKVHWLDAELGLLVRESMRQFGLLSGLWRQHAEIPTSAGTAIYALNTAAALTGLTDFTVTDNDVIELAQYQLIEPISPTGAGLTDQFNFADVVAALQRARNQLLDDAMVALTELTVNVSAHNEQVVLADNVLAVRRAVWRTPSGSYSNVHLDEPLGAAAHNPAWSVSAGTPQLYSVVASPPLTLALHPPPEDNGTLELVVQTTGADLSASSAVVLGVPDDAAWLVRELMLADLLSRDGPGYDPARAEQSRRRYRLGVELLRTSPLALSVSIDGVAVQPCGLAELDYLYAAPHWQSLPRGKPRDVGLIGRNLLALRPIPNGAYSIGVDVVRKANLPSLTDDSDPVQLGREVLDSVLDGAESLALYKLGAAEIEQSERLFGSLVQGAARYNSKLAALGYGESSRRLGRADEASRPERGRGRGVGAIGEAALAASAGER